MYISLKGMGEEIHTISDLEDREGAAKKTCKVTQRKQEGKNSLYKSYGNKDSFSLFCHFGSVPEADINPTMYI